MAQFIRIRICTRTNIEWENSLLQVLATVKLVQIYLKLMDEKISPSQGLLEPFLQEALSKGHVWQVKMVLQSRIRSCAYDPLLYEQYGWLLLRMEDLVEAGKYLFLSGQEKKEYRYAILLYQQIHGHKWQKLVASFPRRAKNADWALFPESVQRKLKELKRLHNIRSHNAKSTHLRQLLGCARSELPVLPRFAVA